MKGLLAVARLGLLEALRARLWLAFVVAGVVLMGLGLRLSAVDAGARLKLAVVGVTGAMGFVVILLAVLAGAQQVRRDLDARLAFMLFAKPLTRIGYLLGRWTGVMTGLLVGILALAAIGTGVIALTFDRLPQPAAVVVPSSWTQISSLGESVPIRADASRTSLSGPVGDGVRWTLTGLPSAPAEGLPILLKAMVRGTNPDLVVDECLVSLEAASAVGAPPVVLSVDAESPYGGGAAPGQVLLRHRDVMRDDQRQDYVRLRLPPSAIAADGSTVIRLVRLDARPLVVLSKDNSLLVTGDGGGLYLNLVRGGLVLLAIAGLLVAATLLVAVVAHLGVSLLAGLTLFFTGSLLWTVQEALVYERLSVPVRRLMELALMLVPDFDRYTVAARLAAGRDIPWTLVGQAWLTYGSYTLVFLLVAWVLLVRKEF